VISGEDAYWDEDERVPVRIPASDIAPHQYPMNVGWNPSAERVQGADGEPVKLWRGCLYVDPMQRGLVRYD